MLSSARFATACSNRSATHRSFACIEQRNGVLHVVGTEGLDAAGDIVLVAVGVRPHTELARKSGIAVNERGAVVVDDRMRTNVDGAWAAGDRVHTHHVLLKEPTYLPLGATKVHVRMTGDRQTGRLLGAQLLGAYGAEISKRVDVVATALRAGASVEDLNELDLSYTPPLSSPWDPIQTAAQSWLRTVR